MRGQLRRAGMRIASALVAVAIGAIGGCSTAPSGQELDRLLDEARAANEAAAASHDHADDRAAWTLRIRGNVEHPTTLAWPEITAVTVTEVRTHTYEEDPTGAAQASRWRGPRVAALIDRAAPRDGAGEITLLAYDGFRATIRFEDALRYPIILAHEVDGRPIPRDQGGPLYVVFPIDDHPSISDRYNGHWWVFYVSDVIVDTEVPELRIGSQTLSRAQLEALPRTSIVQTVGYRVGWPSEPVRLEGVRIRDLLAAAGVTIAPGRFVRVLSHAPITHEDARPTRVRAEDVLGEDVILALWWGESSQPIPARLGGPMTLAFPEHVGARMAEHDWLTFVEALEIETE